MVFLPEFFDSLRATLNLAKGGDEQLKWLQLFAPTLEVGTEEEGKALFAKMAKSLGWQIDLSPIGIDEVVGPLPFVGGGVNL